MNAVFVYGDRTVGLRALEHDCSVFYIPRQSRPTLAYEAYDAYDEPIDRSSFMVDTYTRRGQMYDGRAVFCAEGFDVKEAYQRAVVARCDLLERAEHVRAEMFHALQVMVASDYPTPRAARGPTYIELDRWFGERPAQRVELTRLGLVAIVARYLVAVQTHA